MTNLIKRNPKIVARMVQKKIFAYDPDKNNFIKLNISGSLIWQTLHKPKTIKQLIKVITDNFNISDQKAKIDVNFFIENALKNNLILKR